MKELNALRDLLRSMRFPTEGMRPSATPITCRPHRCNMLAASITALALLTGCSSVPTISSKDRAPSKEKPVSSADQYEIQQEICVGDECKRPFFKKMVAQVPSIPLPILGQKAPSAQKPQAKCTNNTIKPLYDSSLDTNASASPEAPLKPKIMSPSEFVEEWARRWSEKDVEGYFSSYVADFKPSQGISLAAWRAKRQQKMERASRITIALRNMEVEQFGNKATVHFVQDYDSPTERYQLRKSLELVREDGHWKIQKEQVTPGKANASSEAPLKPKIISPSEFVEEWARRWSAKDVEGYFSSYVADFKPSQGSSLAEWRAKRQQKMERASRIKIALKNIEVEDFGNRATVRFVQDYDSSTDRYQLRKSLELVREDGHWKIQKERVIPGKV